MAQIGHPLCRPQDSMLGIQEHAWRVGVVLPRYFRLRSEEELSTMHR
jgi:hypothetical protein